MVKESHSIQYTQPTDRSCRQFLLVGNRAYPSGLMRLRSFPVLLECNDGLLYWFAIKSRSFPEQNEIFRIASLLPETATIHLLQNPTAIEDSIGDETGLSVKFLDGNLEDAGAWHLGDIVTEIVLASIGSATRLDATDCLRSLESDWRENISSFLALLDQETLTAARLLGGLSPKRYNFLVNSDPKVATYRRQAAATMPLLMQQLCENNDSTMAPLLAAIDDGKPLFKLLASEFQVQPSVLKALAGVRPEWLAKAKPNRIAALARLVSAIDANFRPRNEEEWKKFSAALETIGTLSKRSLHVMPPTIWIRHIAQSGYALPQILADNVEAHSQLISRFVNALTSAVAFELEIRNASHLQERAIADLNQHYLLPLRLDRLLEVSRRYGEAFRKAQSSYALEIQALTSLEWPSPIAGALQHDDSSIIPLLSQEELVKEGKAMSNCIGTFRAACAQGVCQIFSIRDLNHHRQSCLETTLHRTPTGRFDLRVVQLKAYGNTTPGPNAKRAVEALVSHVRLGGKDVEEYWIWKTRIAVLSVGQRQTRARMLPVLHALQAVLPARYSIDRVVDSVIMEID